MYGRSTPTSGLPGATSGVSAHSSRRRSEHDRPLRAGQERRLALVDLGEPLGGGEVADHHRERLVGPALAPAQRGDGIVRRRVAGEVVAAQPLDRHDRTVGERPLRGGDGGVGAVDRPGRRLEPQPGPARRARDRLGVEPPVDGVVILGGALAHTTGSPPSSCWGGRTGAGSVIVKRGPQLVQLMNG